MPTLSNDTQDLIKSALGTPAAQQELINAILGVDFNQLASDVLQTSITNLTSAQVLALNTTPVVCVPAPAAGYVNMVTGAYATLAYNSSAYTGSNALTLNYTNGSGAAVASFPTSGFLNASANAAYASAPESSVCTPAAAIVASVGTANPGAGNSPLSIQVFYRTLPAQLP